MIIASILVLSFGGLFIFFTTFCYLAICYVRKKENKERFENMLLDINEAGFIQITKKVIQAIPDNVLKNHYLQTNINNGRIPEQLVDHIRPLHLTEVANLMLKICADSKGQESFANTCRGMTIASAIYGERIHQSCTRLDAPTRAAMARFISDQKPVPVNSLLFAGRLVPKDADETTYANFVARNMDWYLELLPMIGYTVNRYAMLPVWPAKKQFVKDAQNDSKSFQMKHFGQPLEEVEILALATAYAFLTNIPIPITCQVYHLLGASIVNEYMKEEQEPPKLVVVK